MPWKPIQYRWQWQLKSTPEALWPYVADTHRFNQAVDLPVFHITETPLEIGGSRLTAQATRFGVSVEWEELPFDWVTYRWFRSERIFSKGPLARMVVTLTLEPNSQGTHLTYQVEVTPANALGRLGVIQQIGWQTRQNVDRVFRQIDDALQKRQTRVTPLKVSRISGTGQARLKELTAQLTTMGHHQTWVNRLSEMIIEDADLDIARIRPYVKADLWQAPRREILELFLSAARLGLLNLRWDVLCPLCRGAKVTASTLDAINKGVHCPACNIDFEADFSRSVELTFSVHPQIRPVRDDAYCVGGPMVTPHIVVHQALEPNETRILSASLKAGDYRLRTQRPDNVQWLTVAPSPAGGLKIQAGETDMKIEQATDGEQMRLTNLAPYRQRLYIEQAEWFTTAATADEVTTLQHFRDLFSDEVLRPGEEIGVRSLTILFSDLVGSTAMYNELGDAPSYALVRDQFAFLQEIVRRYDGAIVKTIGDAIMAAFVNPARAVEAALAIQETVLDFNCEHPAHPLTIKLGLHTGPCIAVNLNDRLDYFGTTVNMAARLEGQSEGGDVVISEVVLGDSEVSDLLASKPLQMTSFEANIKGFDEHFRLHRLRLKVGAKNRSFTFGPGKPSQQPASQRPPAITRG